MNIAIDGRLLHRKTSGLERYIRSLVGSLSQVCVQHSYRTYVEWPPVPESSFFNSVRMAAVDGDAGLTRDLINNPPDVYHTPWLGLSLSHYLPFFIARAAVATVPDLIQFHFPEYMPKLLREKYRALLYKCIPWADLVVVYSHHTKSDVVRHLKVPDERVAVIPLGVSDQFQPTRQKLAINWLHRKYGIGGPFILHVGKDYPHKNLLALAEAFITLKKSVLPNHLLVLGGESVWQETRAILQYALGAAGLLNSVRFINHVPDDELPVLYQAADVLAFPSLYEGFGLPPIEAMACGTPVVCSNATSLPEVIGDAGLLVDATSPDELAAALERAILDLDTRSCLIERGIQRAQDFRWEKTATRMAQAYELAAELAARPRRKRSFSIDTLSLFPDDIQAAQHVWMGSRDCPAKGEIDALLVNVDQDLDRDAPAIIQAKRLYNRQVIVHLADLLAQRSVSAEVVEMSRLRGLGHLTDVIAMLRPSVVVFAGIEEHNNEVSLAVQAVREGHPASVPVVLRMEARLSNSKAANSVAADILASDVLSGNLASGPGSVLARLGSKDTSSKTERSQALHVATQMLSPSDDLASHLKLPEPLAVIAGGAWPPFSREFRTARAQVIMRRSPESVINEMLQVEETLSTGSTLLVDANLFEDRVWIDEFVQLRRRGGHLQPFGAVALGSSICEAEDIVANLHSVGLIIVLLISQHRVDRPREGLPQDVLAADILRRHGVRVGASYVIGGWGKSLADVVATVRLIQAVHPDVHDAIMFGARGYKLITDEEASPETSFSVTDEGLLRAAIAESRETPNTEDLLARVITLRQELARVEETQRRQFEKALSDTRALLAYYQEECSQKEEQIKALQDQVCTLLGLLRHNVGIG